MISLDSFSFGGALTNPRPSAATLYEIAAELRRTRQTVGAYQDLSRLQVTVPFTYLEVFVQEIALLHRRVDDLALRAKTEQSAEDA